MAFLYQQSYTGNEIVLYFCVLIHVSTHVMHTHFHFAHSHEFTLGHRLSLIHMLLRMCLKATIKSEYGLNNVIRELGMGGRMEYMSSKNYTTYKYIYCMF